MFNLYTPSQNYHLQAKDEKDLRTWVALIRREARIDEEEKVVRYGSPIRERFSQDRLGSSSPEPLEHPSRPSTTRDGIKIPAIRRLSAQDLDYSGDDQGTYSDWDENSHSHSQGFSQPRADSLVYGKTRGITSLGSTPALPMQPGSARNTSRSSGIHIQEEEREIYRGYLLYLKSKRGVRQWKHLWVVLRPKNLAFYKTEEEYAAQLIMPLSSIISAVEVDPVSRSKKHCMQIIAKEKSYRFCASSEEDLAKWLGALKSQLARRKETRKNITIP